MNVVQRIVALTMFASLAFAAMAQDAVPGEILARTLMIRTSPDSNEYGTGFTVDYKSEVYLVTARHVVAGLHGDSPTIQFRRNGDWTDLHVKKVLYPSSDKVDIAVLDTGETTAQPFSITAMDDGGGFTMGQQVWFLGYPLGGLGTKTPQAKSVMSEAPFIKRGTMSAFDATDPEATVLYIDGFNNPGFSGGPIVYWDFKERAYRIAGVVQGYKNEGAKALVNGQQIDTNILVNSGILVAYNITHAMTAIKAAVDQRAQSPAK